MPLFAEHAVYQELARLTPAGPGGEPAELPAGPYDEVVAAMVAAAAAFPLEVRTDGTTVQVCAATLPADDRYGHLLVGAGLVAEAGRITADRLGSAARVDLDPAASPRDVLCSLVMDPA